MSFTNFIKRPVLSTVVSIFFVLLGIIGLVSLPIEQYPNIAPPTITVSATYTGADAQTVLNSVVAPLEESINGVENMTYMTSSASISGMAQDDGKNYIVTAGLHVGDRIVLKGITKLTDGQQIKPITLDRYNQKIAEAAKLSESQDNAHAFATAMGGKK